jgi:hypothetical protein
MPAVGPAPQLFSGAGIAKVDFENDALSQPPEGFDARLGQWTVADSPTATSGNQVVVRGGESAASLALKNAEAVRSAGGEVSVRIFLGTAGAGIECGAREGGSGYALKLEPETRRIALYRKTGEALALVGQAAVSTPKGAWARIGLRCDNRQVTAYVDGKAKLRDRAGVGTFDLGLCADPGVTAQFDDLAYWASR